MALFTLKMPSFIHASLENSHLLLSTTRLSILNSDLLMPAEPIVTTATVTEERDERTVNLTLKNGKITLGHLAKAGLPLRPALKPGTKVQVEMTSFDFEKARIVAILEPSKNDT
jgi:translation initiation factor IF-1